MPDDLEQIIADSVNDSLSDSQTETDTTVDTPVDAPESSESASDTPVEGEAGEELQVPSPGQQTATEANPETPAEPEDEFSKLVGMPKMGVGGRENRIPYSRVQGITKTAVNKLAEVVLGRKVEKTEDATKLVTEFVTSAKDREAKVTEYETRLETVDRFEQVMENDPNQFLNMLAKLPAYKDFFTFVNAAIDARDNKQPVAAEPEPPVDPNAGMPEPDELLSDGSKVYSMEGLKALLAWNSQQTEARALSAYETKLKALEDRYKPMADDWTTYQRREAAKPQIRKQLEEAKTWTLFNESEDEILQVLQSNPNISLEGAYREVVFPKLVADRNKMRQDVLQEVKKAPVASSVPTRAATKPTAPTGEPQSLEDIIRAEVDKNRNRL